MPMSWWARKWAEKGSGDGLAGAEAGFVFESGVAVVVVWDPWYGGGFSAGGESDCGLDDGGVHFGAPWIRCCSWVSIMVSIMLL
jgi:hypothetical protein